MQDQYSPLASGLLDTIGSTRGSVLYRGASGWSALAPGTSAYVLTSNGAGADPSWQASGGGGGGFNPAAATAITFTTGLGNAINGQSDTALAIVGGSGQEVQIYGGDGPTAGGVTLGAGSSSNGHGAGVAISASDGVGTDKNGGFVAFDMGAKTGAGTDGDFRVRATGTTVFSISYTGVVRLMSNSTGGGSAALGGNCPASTLTAPYTWQKVTTFDGSTGYVPIWK